MGGWAALVCVHDETHPLEHPVAGVLRGPQVRLEHEPHAHRVAPSRRRVHRSRDRILFDNK